MHQKCHGADDSARGADQVVDGGKLTVLLRAGRCKMCCNVAVSVQTGSLGSLGSTAGYCPYKRMIGMHHASRFEKDGRDSQGGDGNTPDKRYFFSSSRAAVSTRYSVHYLGTR